MAFAGRNNYINNRRTILSIENSIYTPFKSAVLGTKTAEFDTHDTYRKMNDIRKEEFFHHQIKPLIYVFKTVGAFPVKTGSSGMPAFKLFSLIMVYSVCFYFISASHCIFTIHERYAEYRERENDFTDMIRNAVFTSLSMLVILAPPLMWIDVNTTLIYFTKWKEFQIMFERVTGQRVELGLKRIARIGVAITILGAMSACLMHYMPPFIKILNLPTFVLCSVMTSAPLCVKYAMLRALMTTAFQYNACFKTDLRKILNSSDLLAGYRVLWIRWSKLVSDEHLMLGKMYGIIMLTMLFNVTITVYFLVDTIITGKFGFMSNMDIINTMIPCTLTLLVICDSGYKLHSVGLQVKEELQVIVPSQVSHDVMLEVHTFLNAILMNPPILSAVGFANIDRALFRSFISTIVTYLIVLLQFDSTRETSEKNPSI